LLMHPAGRVHLTSGILPRKSLALARDWMQPGLSVIAPSVRVGPVLIDPGEVRLPKVSVFPKDQLWTRRTSPDTWRDDPIVAATPPVLLPELPHEVREGCIRVSPVQKEGLEDGAWVAMNGPRRAGRGVAREPCGVPRGARDCWMRYRRS